MGRKSREKRERRKGPTKESGRRKAKPPGASNVFVPLVSGKLFSIASDPTGAEGQVTFAATTYGAAQDMLSMVAKMQAGKKHLDPRSQAKPQLEAIPWENFISGLLTNLPGIGFACIHIVEMEYPLPLTTRGAQILAERGQPQWLGMGENEMKREVLRQVLSLKLGVDLPDFETLGEEIEKFNDKGLGVDVLVDEHEAVTRNIAEGEDVWVSQPESGIHLIKVQPPLATSESFGGQPFLVYNKDKTLHMFLSDEDTKTRFQGALGSEIKGFFLADVDTEEGTVQFSFRAQPDPGW